MQEGAATCSCSADVGEGQNATARDDQIKEAGSSGPLLILLAKFTHSVRYLLDLCVDLVVLQLPPQGQQLLRDRCPALLGAGSYCPFLSNEVNAALRSGLDNTRQSQHRCPSSNFKSENGKVLLSHLRSIDQLLDGVHQTYCQIMNTDRESTDELAIHLQTRPQEKLLDKESMESKLASLSRKLEMYETQLTALQHTMERAEIVHARHTVAESGSYEDSSVTPPLLQSGADAVKTAIAMCAGDFLASTKTNFISLQLGYLGLAQNTHFNSTGANSVKVALQAFFCHLVFDGSDQPAMYTWLSRGTDTPTMFERPEQRKCRLFEAYKKFRYCEPQEVQDQNEEFNCFVLTKAHAFMHKHLSRLVVVAGDHEQWHRLQQLVGSAILNNRENAFHGSFLRLLKAVWLLRLLACAMQPNAEMFWVGPNVKFDEEFMEDAGLLSSFPEADEPINCSGDFKRVSFMCVPGFTVRRTIIKAQVYLTS